MTIRYIKHKLLPHSQYYSYKIVISPLFVPTDSVAFDIQVVLIPRYTLDMHVIKNYYQNSNIVAYPTCDGVSLRSVC